MRPVAAALTCGQMDGHSLLCHCRHNRPEAALCILKCLIVKATALLQSTRRNIAEDLNFQSKSTYSSTGCRGAAVSKVTWLTDGQMWHWISILLTGRTILLPTASKMTPWPTEPLIQLRPGFLSPGIKRLGHEDCRSHPSTTKLRMSGDIPQLHHTYS